MDSLVEKFKIGRMIRLSSVSDKTKYRQKKEKDSKHLWSASGIGIVLEKDAQPGGKLLKQMDLFKLTNEPKLNWDSNLSLEGKLEKVFKKKLLLLNIITGYPEPNDTNPMAWHCIDLSKTRWEGDNWVVGKTYLKFSKMLKNPPRSFMCVALGSVIYIIGGDNKGERCVSRTYYLDTSSPESEWLEGPSLNIGRREGSAVVHDGKIYVFGGFTLLGELSEGFGEVYDPVLDSWKPLSDSPEELHWLQCNLRGTYGDRKMFVLPVGSEALYAYDVVDKSWEVLDPDFGSWFCDGVVMDDVLYLLDYDRREIYGYDLVQLKWLKPINVDNLQWFPRPINSEIMELYASHFFEIAARVLCLLYFDLDYHVYCKIFTIKKIIQEDGEVVLEAQVFSSTIYILVENGACPSYVVL